MKIVQLQKRLQQQVVIRRALEKARYLPFSQDATIENSIPEVQLHRNTVFTFSVEIFGSRFLTIHYIHLLCNFRLQRT